MYRPHSLDVSNGYDVRSLHVTPQTLNYEQNKLNIPLQSLRGINRNQDMKNSGSYIQQTNIFNNQINPPGYRLFQRKMENLDYQISHLIRESDDELVSRLSQSQSFSEGPLISNHGWMYRSHHVYAPISHKSRLSTCMYMSPPSPHWTTVGNIMSVKRSTSMPGSRPNSVSVPSKPIHRGDAVHNSMKKKCGPFQCLKHQFRKVGHKDNNNNQSLMPLTITLPPQIIKTPKSMFKKRPTTEPSTDQPFPPTKSKGIRKSISLLFSKSQRSSKSDPSITNKKAPTDSGKHNGKDNNSKSYQHATRRNRSYESMIESGGDVTLSTDTTTTATATATATKSCSYSDVQDSSSSSSSLLLLLSPKNSKPSLSVDLILCRRSPSDASLTDTVSVSSSSERQLNSQTASCQGNMNYRTEENGWKTVVGNVCRSNSKDSAIANSTLSGDGIPNQSKRVSLTSTISRISDLTTASEDFNDSSYSSFNDLQMNSSQYSSHSKPRLIGSAISNLEPIKVNCDTAESDMSPSSDSSTETLRPLSSVHCRRYRSSYSDLISIDLKKSPCRKRSHSWPGCYYHVHEKEITKPSMKPLTTFQSKPVHYPRLKMSYIQQSHLNSSPFLSQYSRLYSLRTSAANEQRNPYCLSNQLSVTSQAPISSPIANKPGTTDSAFPRRQISNR